LYRYRIDKITNETGAESAVNYGTPDTCDTSVAPVSNTNSCYPVFWTPNSTMVMDWFEKYAVTSDTTGGAPAQVTSYLYNGGAAWHYDDNQIVQAQYRTYGQFHGYASVETRTGNGAGDPQTDRVTSYYRGMSDDNSSATVTLTDSQGGSHTDYSHLAGLPLETTVYNGKDGPVDHSSIWSYWISAPTADEPRTGLDDLTAVVVAPAEMWTRQAVTTSGTTSWRYTETDTTYDTTPGDSGFGLPLYVYSHTVPADSAYDRCTATTYAPANTSTNLSGLVASQETDSVACSGFTEGPVSSAPSGMNTLGAPSSVTRPDQVVSATENFYDDTSFSITFPQTTAPVHGDVTMTRKAVSYTSGAFTWQTIARDTYDKYGRVQAAYDADGNETDTSYTVDSAGLTTAVKVTNPLGQSTSETLAPARGLVLTSTDANGVVTTRQYDALGRVYDMWLYSRPTSDNPNYVYSYGVEQTGISGVEAGRMGEGGGYAWTWTMVDSLGRTRQTQSDTPQGGRLITDTFYDSHGWVIKTSNRYYDSSATPSLSIATVADNQEPPPPP
jgi:hypothetical protein